MGYKEGLRPYNGLDGIFLKGKVKGQLIVVIRQSNMNYFYPLAWAIVNLKKIYIYIWTWFLELLHYSLNLKMGDGDTLMSNTQKVFSFSI